MIFRTIVSQGEEPMRKALEKMKEDFAALRTGRANSALVEKIKVESYGTSMPINQLANLSIPDARTIEIRPWDVSQTGNIEKAILKSDLGITPNNDGKTIRISIPKLTEDRRKEIIKMVHKMAEEFKVSIRNIRREIVENIKKAEKDKKISEDEKIKAEQESQKLTDSYIKKIDEILAIKEKEIMEV